MSRPEEGGHDHGEDDGGFDLQTWVTWVALALVAGGLVVHLV